MSVAREGKGLVGVFAHHDALMDGVRRAQDEKVRIIDVYSPVPSHEIMDAVKPGPSPVRFLTFAGALSGMLGGFALAIWSSLEWNLIVGGKPVTSIVPFMVVGFEMLILLGAIATLAGLLVFSRLPFRKFPAAGYTEEFSGDRFGLWLDAGESEQRARRILEESGAQKVISGEEGES